jgi:hypothetical protein
VFAATGVGVGVADFATSGVADLAVEPVMSITSHAATPIVREHARTMESQRRRQPGLDAFVGFGSAFTSGGNAIDSAVFVVLNGFATCGAPGTGVGWAA